MLSENLKSPAHAGEAQVSPPAADRHFFINRPEVGADFLTEADLNEAARVVIGGDV